MDLRITANYPATDGSMPESVEVELTGIEVSVGGVQLLTTVLPGVLDRLTEASARVRTRVTSEINQEEFDQLIGKRTER